jgi:hypothetical protein
MPGPSTGFDTDRIVRQLEEYRQEAVAACEVFVKGEAEGIMERALELVPVETGELAASAFIDPVEQRGGKTSVLMGFKAGHATVVHERLDVHHPNGKQAKYLEAAVNQTAAGASRRMADVIRDHLRERGLG